MQLVEPVILVMKPLALSFPKTLAISMCNCDPTICKTHFAIRLFFFRGGSQTAPILSATVGSGPQQPVMRVRDIYPELLQHMPTLPLKNSFSIIPSIMPNLHEYVTKEKATHEKAARLHRVQNLLCFSFFVTRTRN